MRCSYLIPKQLARPASQYSVRLMAQGDVLGHRGSWYLLLSCLLSAAASLLASAHAEPPAAPSPRILEARVLNADLLAFHPNGELLVSGGHDAIRLWDIADRKELLTIPSANSFQWVLAVSPDGRTVVTALHRTPRGVPLAEAIRSRRGKLSIKIWNLPDGKVRHDIPLPEADGVGACFTPDSRTVVVAQGTADILLFDCQTGGRFGAIQPYEVTGRLAVSADGRLLATGHGELVRIWDLPGRKLRATLGGNDKEVRALAFAPDRNVLAIATGRVVQLWDADKAKHLETINLLRRPLTRAWSLAFSADGRWLAVAGHAPPVLLFDRRSYKTVDGFRARERASVRCLAFSPDSKTLAVGSNDKRRIRLWPVPVGK